MTAITWSGLQTAVAAALVQGQSPWTILPPDFLELFPLAVSYGEGRIYRDCVFLNTRTVQESNVTGGSEIFYLSQLPVTMLVIEGVSLYTGTGPFYRWPFDQTTPDVIDIIWPNYMAVMSPSAADWIGRYWTMFSDAQIKLAPTPDANYSIEITGLLQPTPMSAAVPSTYLGNTYPDLLLASVMVSMSGLLLRNYSAQSDDPRQSSSWEAQYAELLMGAKAEEMRRRGLVPDIQAPTSAPRG